MLQIISDKLKALVVSEDVYEDTKENLRNMGIICLPSYGNKNVSVSLSKHADMQITYIGGNRYVTAPECYDYYKDVLSQYDTELISGDSVLSEKYPGDIAYNLVSSENFAIHNFKYTDKVLLENLKGRKLINISQGYTACTLRMISENAFITSDAGTFKVLSEAGFDGLLISQGNIHLEGYDYGFIGGSTVMISKEIMGVNGKAENHPDYNNIKSFCSKYGVRVLSLSENKMADVGSFIPVY